MGIADKIITPRKRSRACDGSVGLGPGIVLKLTLETFNLLSALRIVKGP